MSSLIPTHTSIRGIGRPRIVLVLDKPSGYIASSSVANPTVITTKKEHRLKVGQMIRIAGHSGATPALNVPSANLIIASDDSTFEVTKGNWADNGNHSASRSTTYHQGGVASLKIVAAGVGDSTTNFCSLPAVRFTSLVAGNKYRLEFRAYGDTVGATLSIVVGDQSGSAIVMYNSSAGTFAPVNIEFIATSSTVTMPIKVFASAACNFYIDEVYFTQIAAKVTSVPSTTSFTIAVNVTVAGTGGTYEAVTEVFMSQSPMSAFDATHCYFYGAPDISAVITGMRVSAYRVVGGLSYPIYAKITAIDKVANPRIVTVDAWTNGTPTDWSTEAYVDGYIVDLPRTQEMVETFDPDVFVHSLYGGDQGSHLETKMRGWKYQCALDYSHYISPDTLLDLAQVLSAAPNDQLVLMPRVDFPQFQINAIFVQPIQLSKFGLSAGYKRVIFVFKSKENLASWQMYSGYGTGYATLYGTNL